MIYLLKRLRDQKPDLPHLGITACRKTYGHPQRCSCSDVGWSV